MKDECGNAGFKKIIVTEDGPYFVLGDIPLVHKVQIVSGHGEPLSWKLVKILETPKDCYVLCRCGQSSAKPFCDATHCKVDFDGTETADTGLTSERQIVYPGSTKLVVRYDDSLCMKAGFCANRKANIQELVPITEDIDVRTQVIGMIERCPSGALTYSIHLDESEIEPDLPEQVAITTEMTSEGSINGSLWVTGGIAIERADGKPLERRNRITLCCCGRSKAKPLCDGTHRPD
ncbi:MAG: CDGSH iron-sulfur domain-containing protein [Anaerolineales bacterium]|nr:CDGSH iron-sulfur domain-containing protein [Anaerolineales bacterium]